MTTTQLDWARRLQAIAQNGLHFSTSAYDRDRFELVRAIAAEMIATQVEPAEAIAAFSLESGYATPKIDTRAVVLREGRLLLAREASDGLWSLPGGWADPGASASENCVREVFEETGLRVRAARLLAVLDREFHEHPTKYFPHVYKMFVHCEIVGGDLTPSDETPEVNFFDPLDLPPLSVARVTQRQIARCLALIADPTAAADFD